MKFSLSIALLASLALVNAESDVVDLKKDGFEEFINAPLSLVSFTAPVCIIFETADRPSGAATARRSSQSSQRRPRPSRQIILNSQTWIAPWRLMFALGMASRATLPSKSSERVSVLTTRAPVTLNLSWKP